MVILEPQPLLLVTVLVASGDTPACYKNTVCKSFQLPEKNRQNIAVSVIFTGKITKVKLESKLIYLGFDCKKYISINKYKFYNSPRSR